MKIIRSISAAHPSKCHMVAKGFFGNVKGEVKYDNYAMQYGFKDMSKLEGYFVIVNGELKGSNTDFYDACNMLLDSLGIVKTICV